VQFVLNVDLNQGRSKFAAIEDVGCVIRSFLTTFEATNEVTLHIFVADDGFSNFKVHALLREWIDQERHLYKADGRVEIHAPGDDAVTVGEPAVTLDQATTYSPDDLFRMYREEGGRLRAAYEKSTVSDRYDPDIISLHKQEGDTNFGNTQPDWVWDYTTYIVDPDNGISSVLDVGCGVGIIYDQLRRSELRSGRRMPLYAGVDYSRSQIERARRKYPRAFFQYGDAADLPFPDNSFDLTVAYSVLGFMPLDRIPTALCEMHRVSRKGMIARVLCSSKDDDFPSEPVRETVLWGKEYPLVTSSPDFHEISELISGFDTVETQVNDLIMLEMVRNQTTCPLKPGTQEYDIYLAILTKITGGLAEKYGSKDDVPRDEVENLMMAGGKVQFPGGIEAEFKPGMRWVQFKEILIRPKNWCWTQPESKLESYWTDPFVVNRS